MNKNNQRIAIAKATGWTCKPEKGRIDTSPIWHDPQGFAHIPAWNEFQTERHPVETVLPDYLNDRNAMHAAEEYLEGDQRSLYYDILSLEAGDIGKWDAGETPWQITWFCFHEATPAQRAESFLRTLKLWTA